LDGKTNWIEMAGNLVPVTKSGDQLHFPFHAFRENRVPFTIRVRDTNQEPTARVAFMKDPKTARGEAPQTPVCSLNIKLPDFVKVSQSLNQSWHLGPVLFYLLYHLLLSELLITIQMLVFK
jgi:hypothetical protein